MSLYGCGKDLGAQLSGGEEHWCQSRCCQIPDWCGHKPSASQAKQRNFGSSYANFSFFELQMRALWAVEALGCSENCPIKTSCVRLILKRRCIFIYSSKPVSLFSFPVQFPWKSTGIDSAHWVAFLDVTRWYDEGKGLVGCGLHLERSKYCNKQSTGLVRHKYLLP